MKHIRTHSKLVATAVAAALAAGAAHAQQTGRIEVTGSNIKQIDTETPSPVAIITREQIQNSGTRDIAELLRNLSIASAGSQMDQSANSFSNGAQTVSIRGLGSAGTLVLVNGRRMTPSAYADPNTGNSTVYNLNAIPMDAIQRIEILKDGASAIYGSDAMAGVVNIILRQDYRGLEATGSYSNDQEGVWGSWRGSITAGFGDLARQGWNIIGTYEHYHRDPVNIREISNVAVDENIALGAWRTTQSANGFPANYFRENVLGNGNFATFVGIDANCPADRIIAARCRYDTYRDVAISFKQDRDDAYLRGTINLNKDVSAFGELLFSRLKTEYYLTPFGFSNAITVWGTEAGALRQYRLVLPVGHPDNPTNVPVAAAYSFADVGRRSIDQVNDTYRALGGIKGTFGAWDWETAVLWMSNQREDANRNYLYFPGLQSVVNDRSYRFDGRQNSPEVLARVGTSFIEEGESSVTSWDGRATRELMEMAGGPMAIAAGFELRREELKITSDPKIVAGDIVGRGTTSANGSRDVAAFYAELSAPFARGVETQVAVRGENYSDFGNSVTPKLGIKWHPVQSFALRGTYAKGFRAPSLSQVSDSSVQAFNNNVRDPLRCPTFVAGNPDCAATFASYIRANPDLEPEKSDNYTVGFILSPTRNFTTAVDFWSIRRKDQIDRFPATYLLARESQFPDAIVRDPNPATWLPGVPNSGPIFAVIRQFFNLAETRVSGVDVDMTWVQQLGGWGRLETTFLGTYMEEYKYALAIGDPVIDQAGTFGGPSDALPRFRGNLAMTWSRGPWAVTGRLNYVRGWFNGSAGNTGTCGFSSTQLINGSCDVDDWTTVDLGVNYTGIKNLHLNLLVRNVTDRGAPYDANFSLTTQQGFNPVYHNALGRYYTANVTYKFR